MKIQFTGAVLWLMTLSAGTFAQDVDRPSVRDSIRDSFPTTYDGIAETYGLSDVPELIEILNSDDEEHDWPRVVAVLGIIGDEDAADVLIRFIEKPIVGPTFISPAQYDARGEAIRSLGFLVARTGSERALDYLIESLDDGVWRRRNILGVPSFLGTYDQYDRQLSIHAIFGLALSGHPRAGEALRALQQSPTAGQTRLRSGLDATLDSWIPIYDVTAELGVSGMYEHYENLERLEAERLEDARRLREVEGR